MCAWNGNCFNLAHKLKFTAWESKTLFYTTHKVMCTYMNITQKLLTAANVYLHSRNCLAETTMCIYIAEIAGPCPSLVVPHVLPNSAQPSPTVLLPDRPAPSATARPPPAVIPGSAGACFPLAAPPAPTSPPVTPQGAPPLVHPVFCFPPP